MSAANRAYMIGASGSLVPSPPGAESPLDLLVGAEQSEGAYALSRYRTTEQIYPHIHALDDESVFVLSGSPTVTVGDTPYVLEPGGFCFMPRGVTHSIASSAPWEGLSVSAPGGVFDALMRDLADVFASATDLSKLGEQVGSALRTHGITVHEGKWVGELEIRQ